MIGIYTSTVSQTFIDIRNRKYKGYKHGIRGVDCEFPEWDQRLIDPKQTEYKHSIFCDNIHTEFGNVDYKNYSQEGPYLSDSARKAVINGVIDNLVIWKWLPNNKYVELKTGMKVSYEIIGIISRKMLIDHFDKLVDNPRNSRFPKDVYI